MKVYTQAGNVLKTVVFFDMTSYNLVDTDILGEFSASVFRREKRNWKQKVSPERW
jgi:hypothetical protein